jgi:rhodanese-related sulfurtransferase
MRLGRRHLWQMLALVLAGLLLGLGRNLFSGRPLPLLRPLPAPETAAAGVRFSETDAEFVRQIGAGSGIMLLDARAAADFRAGHIPGAISLPVGDFPRIFAGLEPGLRQARLLVVYCSGRTCNDSRELAGMLWEKGLKSILLYKGGMEDWQGGGRGVQR